MRPTLLAAGLLLGALPARAATTAATHDGTWQSGQVLWETEWRAEPAVGELEFAVPLPNGTRLVGGREALRAVQDAEGRVTGVALDRPALDGTLRLAVPQGIDESVLWAPLLAGDAPQRVVLDGARFVPDDALGLEKHIKYWAEPGLESRARRQFERGWVRSGGDRAHTSDQALYVRAEGSVAGAGGLIGRLEDADGASPGVYAFLYGALALLLAGAVALYRGLGAAARAEANHAYIHGAFRDPGEPR